MGSFILTLISVAILNSAVGMISPEGDTKKYVRFLGSLCILCAIAFPIYSAVAGGELSFDNLFSAFEDVDAKDYEDVYADALLEQSRENAQLALKSEICERFSIADDQIDVGIEFDKTEEKCVIEGVTVFLHTSFVAADPRSITEHVEERAECPCTVIYD